MLSDLKSRLVRLLVLIFLSSICAATYAQQEAVYRTGLAAKKAWFSVSPDGKQLIFSTDRQAHGLRLIDLSNGKVTVFAGEVGRDLSMPDWSPDGKRIALVSAAIRDGYYSLDGMEILVADVASGQRQKIATSDGVKFFPFFSADGKTLYYFNGKKREEGKTPASRYDLYAVDLSSGKYTRVTHEEFYQAGKGDDTQRSVLFDAIPNFSKRFKDAFGVESRGALFLYDKPTSKISTIAVDQSSGIFNFSDAQRDKAGNLHFIAAKNRPGGGNYLWFLVRTTPEGKQAEILADLPISMAFDIAQNTGEIYVSDKAGEELIFRRLPILAAH